MITSHCSRKDPARTSAEYKQKSENSLEAAEIFNTFFSEIGTNLSKDVAEAEVSYSDFLTETVFLL